MICIMVKRAVGKSASKDLLEIKWVLISAILITIFINPSLADPFNAPKMYLLMLCTVIIVSFLIFSRKSATPGQSKIYLFAFLFMFLGVFIIQVLFTDLKYAAIFGENLRQLGLVTYFGFVMFMLATIKFFKYEARIILINSILTLSIFYIVYGLIQYTDNDPLNWVNQYNPIIGTLGNPNYSSAFMAVLSTLCFSFSFDQNFKRLKRILFFLIALQLAIVIYLTDASQGMLSLAAGIGLFISMKLLKFKPILGFVSFTLLIASAMLALAGILQAGPLTSFLYKNSVTLRGYYWRAGIEMLQNNWLTGVGIERYGVHFRQSVNPDFPAKYGYELITTNAHNVPIQLFATGGVFLGVAYLAIQSLVIYYALLGTRKISGNRLNLLIGMLSAWVAYQLQSFVSIDNIGLTIWGWVLGGAIVGLVTSSIYSENINTGTEPIPLAKKKLGASFQPLVTGIMLIACLILVFSLTRSESLTFKNRNQLSQVSNQSQGSFKTDLNSVINDPLAQPIYKIEAADMFYMLGDSQGAINGAEKVLKQDPINSTYLGVLATMYERSNRYSDAIDQRLILSKYDPYNVKNYLQLIKLYKQAGNLAKATEKLNKIISLNPNSEVADLARKELK